MAITKRQFYARLADLEITSRVSRAKMRSDGNMIDVTYDEIQDAVCRHYTAAELDDLGQDDILHPEVEKALNQYVEAVRNPHKAKEKRYSGRVQRV